VLAARDALARGAVLMVAFGDTPLIRPRRCADAGAAERAQRSPCSVFVPPIRRYGRLLSEGDRLVAIRRHADATPTGAQGHAVQCRVMAFDGKKALAILDKIARQQQGEYYCRCGCDCQGHGIEAVVIEPARDEWRHQHQAQLAEAEAVMQARLRKAALDAA